MKAQWFRLLAVGGLACALPLASPGQQRTRIVQPELTPMEALRMVYQRGQHDQAARIAYAIIFNDMRQPEALYYLAMSLERLQQKEQAAAFVHVLQSVLAGPEFARDPQAEQYRRYCRTRLETLDADWRAAQKRHLAAAPNKKFTAPEQVDDLWMTQVTFDLHPIHGLYAWTLVGGRKDASPDWIHNRQGQMHRSGAKYMEDIHGRKGVLFSVPLRRSHAPSRAFLPNPAGNEFLRIGVRAYNFPFTLNVLALPRGGRTASAASRPASAPAALPLTTIPAAPRDLRPVFSKVIGPEAWQDLKIPLSPTDRQADILLELIVPEDQRWAEGLFFDYIDFFAD